MYKKFRKNEDDETQLRIDAGNDDNIDTPINEHVVEEVEITSDKGYVYVDETNSHYKDDVQNLDGVQIAEENNEEKSLKDDDEKTLQQNKKFLDTFFSHFQSIFRSKNGKKLIILLICVVLFISFALIYGVATKYSMGSVFQSNVNAFVKNVVGDSGHGELVPLNISDLEHDKKNNNLYFNYQYIQLNGKDLDKDKKLGTLNFYIASKIDMTINVALVIKRNETEILQRFTYVVAKKGAYTECKISVKNKIKDFDESVKMILTFAQDFDASINIFNMHWTTY